MYIIYKIIKYYKIFSLHAELNINIFLYINSTINRVLNGLSKI